MSSDRVSEGAARQQLPSTAQRTDARREPPRALDRSLAQLQRTAGNRAVTALLRQPGSRLPPVADPRVIQRKAVDGSGQVLTPSDLKQAFAGTAYELRFQTKLVRDRSFREALGTGNPMFFTVENVKDFLDGKPIPGLSTLDPSGIAAAGEAPAAVKAGSEGEELWDDAEWSALGEDDKAKARAATIAETLKRLVKNREDQAKKDKARATTDAGAAGPADAGVTPDPAGADEQTDAVADAFASSTFYYGTTGQQVPMWKNFMARVQRVKKARMGDQAGTYSAGTRTLAFLRDGADGGGGAGGQQMMDMYYGGQEFEAFHMLRNPIIGRYVHDMMGYAGEYDQTENPDTVFRRNFPLGGGGDWDNRGWSQNAKPKNNPALAGVPDEWEEDKSGTMEISRVIREGVFKYGGTIVFEGKGLFWQGTFVQSAYKGDTNIEAISMMPGFAKAPGMSRVPHGKGEFVFHWGGTERMPTRKLFLQSWLYGYKPGYETADRKVRSEVGDEPVLDWFWDFPRGGLGMVATDPSAGTSP